MLLHYHPLHFIRLVRAYSNMKIEGQFGGHRELRAISYCIKSIDQLNRDRTNIIPTLTDVHIPHQINQISEMLFFMDQFHHNIDFLAYVGLKKQEIICKIIDERMPSNILEIGSYVGYTTLSCAKSQIVNRINDPKIVCLEKYQNNIALANKLIQYCKLNFIKIFHGTCDNILSNHTMKNDFYLYLQQQKIDKFDLIIMDHDRSCYLNDLCLLMKYHLININCKIIVNGVEGHLLYGDPYEFIYYIHKNTDKFRLNICLDDQLDGKLCVISVL